MRITLAFETLEELKFEHYKGVITLDKVREINIDSYNIDELIELIGEDKLIEAIGRSSFERHFCIDTGED